MKNYITQEQLKEFVSYDPLTGTFIRLKGKGKGLVAGSLNRTKGYIYLRVDGHRYMAHRLAWLYVYGAHPEDVIDHKNGIKDDNKISNLRVVTKSENQRNRVINKNNSSGILGVYKNKNRWVAQITLDGVTKSLGSYTTRNEAAQVRKAADLIYDYYDGHGKKL